MLDWPQTWQMLSGVGAMFGAAAMAYYALLVLRTLQAMHEQRNEMQQNRLDALRPAVVAVGPSEVVEYHDSLYAGLEDRKQLTLRNNGPGPAFNVAIAIGRRLDDGRLDRESLLPEIHSGAPDMVPKELATAVQWTQPTGIKLEYGQVLTIVYDDVYGRHFRTTSHRKGVGWLAEELEQIPQRKPRIDWNANMGV